MEIRETTLSFPIVRGSGPMSADATLVFPRQVDKAVAAVRGYQVGFSGDDHHVGLLEIELETVVNQNVVTVKGQLGCRDWSGNWDDDYGGAIQVSVLAELVSATLPPPRGDLLIEDLEISQATQFFRSSEHLDTANVRPDNSIPLVAGKTTGIRAYVDYDAASGLPVINNLSGELIVNSGGATGTFAPSSTITPRGGTEIDRGTVRHTLNFSIPGEWCDGSVDIRLRVFDVTAPGQASGTVQRTLRFVRVNPLRVYAVGVNYTGMGLNLAAPVETDFAVTLDYTRRTWPVGDVLLSGYTTLQFSEDLSGTASEGCGDGFNSLLDELRDIKGDTDDLVYGLLPSATPLTGVGGCGGDGAGTGKIGNGVTAAHEAAHAVGRKHAPCDDEGRCDSPLNTDDDYPHYGSYVSDSIGEFGYDPENDMVFDPAAFRDFMGYSPSNWISPYTYAALFAKGDPQPASGSPVWMSLESASRPPPEVRPEWVKRRTPVLFLRVFVDGDDVEVRPSFSYEAYRRLHSEDTRYDVVVMDEKGKVIACTGLKPSSAACCGCHGATSLIAEVPLGGEPHQLIVRREGRELKVVDFEKPVSLSADWERTPERDFRLSWQGSGSGAPIHYLVQWRDRDGTWRGAAPRTRNTEVVLPRRLKWATKGEVEVRVLATEGLTTSMYELKLSGENTEPPVKIVAYDNGAALGAIAHDPLGRQLPSSHVSWFDERGGEVGRGNRLARRYLKEGVVRAVPTGAGVSGAESLAMARPAPSATSGPEGSEEPSPPDRSPPLRRRGGSKGAN